MEKKQQDMVNKPRKRWLELRTERHRIEGLVFLPAGSKGRRIADLIAEADRGKDGMLHLVQVTVYDLESDQVLFRKPSLAVNRSQVLYACPLAANEALPKRGVEGPMVGTSAN